MTPSRYCSLVLAASAALLLTSSPQPVCAADALQEAVLREGSFEWNEMRKAQPSVPVDLSEAKLKGRPVCARPISARPILSGLI